MSRSIDEIIEAQGWDTDSVNDLLFRYIENQGSMDALSDFLERAAEEENGDEAGEPTLFKATIEVLIRASSEDEAKDAISEALTNNLLQDPKSGWLDWQYATVHNGEFQREPGPKAIAESDANTEFPDYHGSPRIRETFTTPFTQHKDREGQAFKVIRKITEPDATHDEESLPMYVIVFGDGVQIEAFPSEVENYD